MLQYVDHVYLLVNVRSYSLVYVKTKQRTLKEHSLVMFRLLNTREYVHHSNTF